MLDLKYVILTSMLYFVRIECTGNVTVEMSNACRDVEVVPNVTLADLEGVSYYLKYTSILLKTKIDGVRMDIQKGEGPPHNYTTHYAFINEHKKLKIVKSWGLLTHNEGVNQILNMNVTENYYILSFEKNNHVLMYICNPRAPLAIDARVLYTTNTKLNMQEALYVDKQIGFVGELHQCPNTHINILTEITPNFD